MTEDDAKDKALADAIRSNPREFLIGIAGLEGKEFTDPDEDPEKDDCKNSCKGCCPRQAKAFMVALAMAKIIEHAGEHMDDVARTQLDVVLDHVACGFSLVFMGVRNLEVPLDVTGTDRQVDCRCGSMRSPWSEFCGPDGVTWAGGDPGVWYCSKDCITPYDRAIKAFDKAFNEGKNLGDALDVANEVCDSFGIGRFKLNGNLLLEEIEEDDDTK